MLSVEREMILACYRLDEFETNMQWRNSSLSEVLVSNDGQNSPYQRHGHFRFRLCSSFFSTVWSWIYSFERTKILIRMRLYLNTCLRKISWRSYLSKGAAYALPSVVRVEYLFSVACVAKKAIYFQIADSVLHTNILQANGCRQKVLVRIKYTRNSREAIQSYWRQIFLTRNGTLP